MRRVLTSSAVCCSRFAVRSAEAQVVCGTIPARLTETRLQYSQREDMLER